jgi:folate-binding protein YgfZ
MSDLVSPAKEPSFMLPPPVDTRPAHQRAGLYVHSKTRPVLSITGNDRTTFLQGLLCQDVATQETGTIRYGFFLNPKARILFDAWTAALPDSFLLSPSGGSEEELLAHLKKYLFFRTQATLTSLTGQYRSMTLVGPETPALATPLFASDPASDGYRNLISGGFAFIRPHNMAFGKNAGPWIDLWIPSGSFETVRESLSHKVLSAGGVLLDEQGMGAYRIEQGLPSVPEELNAGHFPAEAGLDEVAISYNKGCYVGQEPVTRLKFQGHLGRRLSGVVFESESPDLAPCPRPLFSSEDGSEVGILTSQTLSPWAGKPIGLGYVKRTHWEAGTKLIDGSGKSLLVSEIPFSPGP